MARGVFTASSALAAADLNDCFAPPRCRLTNSADISVANSSSVSLTFDTEVFDSGAMHSTSTNTGRITVPTGGGGVYVVGGTVEFAANATGYRSIGIRLNGGNTITGHRAITSSASVTTRLSTSAIYSLAAGDYLELQVFQNSGGALNALALADYSPTFWACWLAVA